MTKHFQAIRGMNDILPEDTVVWQHVEDILKHVMRSYGYAEIRLPIVEYTPLFKRAMGDVTDVVEKEMYSFDDRNSESLTLRPEGTAGCVRAAIEHSLLYNQEQRLWYSGPMFRYERPQKGRYRQFHQTGAEIFGLVGPDVDAELIMMTARAWKKLGIDADLRLELNSIGAAESRVRYRDALVEFLEQHIDCLDEDCRRRMHTNPLRILDSKNPAVQALLNDAPVLLDYLDTPARAHFDELLSLLDESGISYVVNPRLVRGLDYYNYTVFEWVTDSLGAQGTICAGGRYDALVEQLGGRPTSAVGFAIGMERLVLLAQSVYPANSPAGLVDACVIASGQFLQSAAMQLAEQVRDALPGIKLMTLYAKGNVKKQFSRANKVGARAVLVLGEDELKNGQITVKDLSNGKQETLMRSETISKLNKLLTGSKPFCTSV